MEDKLEYKRLQALRTSDSKTYYRLCRYMDKVPENLILFKRGEPATKIPEKQFQRRMKLYMSNYGLNGGAISYGR